MRRMIVSVAALLLAVVFAAGDVLSGAVMVRQEVVEGVRVISGGVGRTEREYLMELEGEYSLKLVFALDSGSYLSSVPVRVTGGDQVSIRAESAGPWMYLDLPPGTYTINAVHQGVEVSRVVSIHGTGRSVVSFTWAG